MPIKGQNFINPDHSQRSLIFFSFSGQYLPWQYLQKECYLRFKKNLSVCEIANSTENAKFCLFFQSAGINTRNNKKIKMQRKRMKIGLALMETTEVCCYTFW